MRVRRQQPFLLLSFVPNEIITASITNLACACRAGRIYAAIKVDLDRPGEIILTPTFVFVAPYRIAPDIADSAPTQGWIATPETSPWAFC
jgi:hypothetical protein